MHDALLWQTAQAQTVLANRDVGAAIRLARQHRCWRQADLAAVAGYSVSTISRLETSRRAPADLDQIRRMAAAVRIPGDIPSELLGVSPPGRTTVDRAGDRQDEEADMRRRELLAASLAVSAALLAGVDEALAMLPEPSAPVSAFSVSGRLSRLRDLYDADSLARVIGALPDLLGQPTLSREPAPAPHSTHCSRHAMTWQLKR